MRNRFVEKDVRAFWNGVAEIYERENVNLEYTHHQRYQEAIRYLPSSGPLRVLNFWSRLGFLPDYVARRNPEARVVSGEIAEKLLFRAKQLFPGHYFYHGGFHALPFRAATFDAVVSLETLEHVPRPPDFLGELHRVLKPGGTLVMSLPPAVAEYTTPYSNLFHHGEGPHRFLASKTVKRLLDAAGFELLDHRGTLIIPVAGFGLGRLNAWLERHCQGTIIAEFGIRQFYHARRSVLHQLK